MHARVLCEGIVQAHGEPPRTRGCSEAHKAAILSRTEGEDAPVEHAEMFTAADVLIIDKIDLMPYPALHVEACIDNAKRVNPGIVPILVSAASGAQMDRRPAWIGLARHRRPGRQRAVPRERRGGFEARMSRADLE